MTWKKWHFFLLIITYCTCCFSKNRENPSLKQHQSQVSEDLAHVVWDIMETYEGEYNFQEVLLTLKKLNTGRIESKPLKDCYPSLITSLANKATEKELLNLQAAESYLCKIANRKDIQELVKDKLYYKILTDGVGKEIKNIKNAPLISFREKTLNGKILSENTSGIRILSSEMIPGLRQALEGMKVGEKREVFIHPNLAYREFPKPEPYSLIVIEVSLLSL
ncbi:MAG: FKBP-type peptidyl-prolyl cis-trans isomerase [Candidatus Rhabdochlamydia sp.]